MTQWNVCWGMNYIDEDNGGNETFRDFWGGCGSLGEGDTSSTGACLSRIWHNGGSLSTASQCIVYAHLCGGSPPPPPPPPTCSESTESQNQACGGGRSGNMVRTRQVDIGNVCDNDGTWSAWDESGCSCPTGQTWYGTTCGCPEEPETETEACGPAPATGNITRTRTMNLGTVCGAVSSWSAWDHSGCGCPDRMAWDPSGRTCYWTHCAAGTYQWTESTSGTAATCEGGLAREPVDTTRPLRDRVQPGVGNSTWYCSSSDGNWHYQGGNCVPAHTCTAPPPPPPC
jgi:hypothetical protein